MEPRTWSERLFSFPWTPWRAQKNGPVKVYVLKGVIICSPAIYDRLQEDQDFYDGLLDEYFEVHSNGHWSN